jgi:hypothetical protein
MGFHDNYENFKAIQSLASYGKISTLKRSKIGRVVQHEKSVGFAWS